jgi:hypothetical protein
MSLKKGVSLYMSRGEGISCENEKSNSVLPTDNKKATLNDETE